jgi:hypothetical protein
MFVQKKGNFKLKFNKRSISTYTHSFIQEMFSKKKKNNNNTKNETERTGQLTKAENIFNEFSLQKKKIK